VKRRNSALATAVLSGPAALIYIAFFVVPAVLGFGYAFTDWNGWNKSPDFVGLDNFKEMLHDQRLLSSALFTLEQTVGLVLAFTFGALLLAVLLDRIRRMKALIRALFFYPYLLSILIAGLLFQYLSNYRTGAVNVLLRNLGLPRFAQDWMGDPKLVPFFIFALCVWSALGFFSTLYLAALQSIPAELFEAAELDGARAGTVFRSIQAPLVRPTRNLCAILSLIFGVNLFGQIVVTTQGGPGYRTSTIGYHIYWLGVLNNRQGYAASISLAVCVLLALAALAQHRLSRREVW
jgi:multiple sugar transport system permease protein/raffinose/stachyose/melibiose transport system permease protein